jgi:hypothetical protein
MTSITKTKFIHMRIQPFCKYLKNHLCMCLVLSSFFLHEIAFWRVILFQNLFESICIVESTNSHSQRKRENTAVCLHRLLSCNHVVSKRCIEHGTSVSVSNQIRIRKYNNCCLFPERKKEKNRSFSSELIKYVNMVLVT